MVWFLKSSIVERWAYANIFDKGECEKIIEIGERQDQIEGGVGGVSYDSPRVDKSIRKSNIAWLPSDSSETDWIYSRCTDGIIFLNENYFQYDLIYFNMLQFSKYEAHDKEAGGFYEKHTDYLYDSGEIRKLSFSIQLSDPNSYEGGDLIIYDRSSGSHVNRDQGTMNAFPSFTLHEVTPVTKGTRYSLVGWVCGPRFK